MDKFTLYAPYAIAALGASSGLQGMFAPAFRAASFGLKEEQHTTSPLMPLIGVRDLVSAVTMTYLAYTNQYKTLATIGLIGIPVVLTDAYIAHVHGKRDPRSSTSEQGASKGIGHLIAAGLLGIFFYNLRRRQL